MGNFSIEELEGRLDSFHPSERKEALQLLWERVQAGEISLPQAGTWVNLHCHTFFSYNTNGYSPSKFAWLARKRGLAVAGIVDFDVLDGLEEFLEAGRLLGLKAVVNMETRVYVPEFAEVEITSPGEQGISYHMGVGFPTANLQGATREFLLGLGKTSQQRNRDLMARVNQYLRPVQLNYEQDVLPLTPAGNATERHICLAFARKARSVFTDDEKLASFWAERLEVPAESLDLPEGRNLQNMIRAKTMKCGGVGYVQPEKGSFPKMAETNRFILAAGGIPTLTWLDGTSEGEKAIDELLKVAMSTGVRAINIIPDRNYGRNVNNEKLANLSQVVELAEKLHLPIVVGTEMNSPGQKFVDDFESRELSSLVPVFLKGAHIVYAHSVLQQKSGLGYTSEWAKKKFASVRAKNEFFKTLGSLLPPAREDLLSGLQENVTPQEVLGKLSNQDPTIGGEDGP